MRVVPGSPLVPPAADRAVRTGVPLAGRTTLRLGGPAARFTEAATEDELIGAVRAADGAADPVLVLGGGSNVVIADAGFPGTVVAVATRGITRTPAGRAARGLAARDTAAGDPAAGDTVLVEVAAGENWDALVRECISGGLSGLECLSGIPGLTGATPIQNVGAYGHEVAETIASVRGYDRLTGQVTELTGADCAFGYRTSMFKRRPAARRAATAGPAAATGRYVLLTVTFALARGPLSAPVRYAELAGALGVPEGGRAPLADVRAAVLELRRGKGMVLDPADPDTRSAGSFFTNPVVSPARLGAIAAAASARAGKPVTVPHYLAASGQVKVPAGWLIEHAGFTRGYPGAGPVRISAKHTLALTNPGGGPAAALLDLAREIRAGVAAAFGVQLAAEPVIIGADL